MPVHFSIPTGLVEFVNHEIAAYRSSFKAGDLQMAWRHLERAHILGQSSPYQHTRVHWKMLIFAFRIKNGKEIFGQFPRLIFGGVKSFVGKIPLGNTGGANVHPLQPMEIPEDLKLTLKKHLGDYSLYQKI
jgi:Protein of unknown function (DUF3703)